MSEQAGMKENDGSNPNIFDLLKQDHEAVNNMLKQIVESEVFNPETYEQAKKALKAHFAGEEKLFYSRLENNREIRSFVLEAYEAHDLGKQIMIDIDMSENFSADWLFVKVKMLSLALLMHFKEEENNVFKKAKNFLSVEDEQALGKLFVQEKNSSH